VNLKIGKLGGLTKARAVRDLCAASGIPMNIEDTWGGDITQVRKRHFLSGKDAHFTNTGSGQT
jgi:hypothetical protein